MTRVIHLSCLSGILLFALTMTAACNSDDDPVTETPKPATMFYAAYAEADVTPPDGTPMGAYGIPGGSRRTEGVHDPAMAQVTFFRNDADEELVLVAVDTPGYFYEFGDWGPGIKQVRIAAAEQVKATHGIDMDPESIIISSTHSHSAADLIGFWCPMDEGPDKDLLQSMQDKIAGAITEAAGKLQPATVKFAHTELVGLAGRDDDCCGKVIDNSVDIIQVVDAQDQPMVVLTNYAYHPTKMGSSNQEVSADWIWGYREEMKKETGTPAMFLQGFEAAVHGGTMSVAGDDAWERCYNNGKVVAETVMAALPDAVPSTSFGISHRATTVSCLADGELILSAYWLFLVPKRTMTEVPEGPDCERDIGSFEFCADLYIDEIETSWHRLGDAEFAAFPGEGDPQYGLALKGHMVQPFKFALGLANDSLGYLISPEDLAADEGGRLMDYEIQMGLGVEGGPCVWAGQEDLSWFDGAWQSTTK